MTKKERVESLQKTGWDAVLSRIEKSLEEGIEETSRLEQLIAESDALLERLSTSVGTVPGGTEPYRSGEAAPEWSFNQEHGWTELEKALASTEDGIRGWQEGIQALRRKLAEWAPSFI